ncbi:DUF1754-domain-containing protein [Rhizodiscina lignyota]|uniref:DUF1754-domain-containing protein n=1 Tax=Rhizodiscina lignyota TaxID=1504668 RepID=A0A9P4M953_9PEZI|nr:DUF1754-domain-containing protein [Rhizodiscina lignyota]
MPPSSEYTSVGGGPLKLKGGVDIDKKRKKKKKPKPESDKTIDGEAAASKKSTQEMLAEEDKDVATMAETEKTEEDDPQLSEELRKDLIAHRGKTEAERRHEERRRKRLDERLKREGVKTHKERVQELNRYLSNLSEHHDMPKIGPG